METRSLPRKVLAQTLGILVLWAGASLPALAQDNGPGPEPSVSPANPAPEGPGAGKHHANPDKVKQRQLAKLEKMVQLTPAQETKVTPIISNFVDQLMAVREDSSLQPDARKARQKELRRQYNKEVRSILTPEQKLALKAARAAQHQSKGQNQNQNPNQNENETFDPDSTNQPGSGI
jgi:hypothetical protein